MADRINDIITIDKETVSSLFAPFDSGLAISHIAPVANGMSNTGYVVETPSGKFLLKLYSNPTDRIETALYSYLVGKINVPRLYYYDGDRRSFDFSYAIVEYLAGGTLGEHIRSIGEYPREMAREAGNMCAVLHRKKYSRDAGLSPELCEKRPLPPTREHLLLLLDGNAGRRLKSGTRKLLSAHIAANPGYYDEIEAQSVLCHGDLNYANIMFSGEKMYFIDFEFAHSGSAYIDIGKFFRKKTDDIERFVDKGIYEAFANGYNAAASAPLPADWLRLARLCDIDAMLCLINGESAPADWVEEIERDILSAIKA